jgi:hypothetical protein
MTNLWTALFLLLDAVAIACAVLAVVSKDSKLILRAFLWSGVVTVGLFVSSVLAPVLGIGVAFRAAESGDTSLEARQLAEGISTAMNAAAFGLLFTVVGGVACFVCLVMLVIRRKSQPSS